jgi:hypothetical protein
MLAARRFLVLSSFVSLLTLSVGSTSLIGCGSFTRAQAKDPQRCERDPKCARKRGKSNDCSTQCSDDPVCEQRCREFEITAGTAGR